MKRRIFGKSAVMGVAAVVGVGLATSTLALAVSSSSHGAPAGYSACSNSSDELFVEVNGHCPAGTHHITLSARGPKGPAGANGAPGATGPTGPAGARGPAGANGTDGTNGTNGFNILTGSTAPSGTCTTGDSYIDDHYTSSDPAGEVYNCISGAWVDSGNSIQGPQGLPGLNGTNGTNGSNGSSVLTGSAVPTGSCTTGDSYVDLTAHDALPAGEVYQCVSSAWSDSGDTIQGPKGPAGVTEGISATSTTVVPLTTAMSRVPVMSTPAVPSTGDWFVSASITVTVATGDYVACYIDNEIGPDVPVVGPVANETYETLPLEGVVNATAGDPLTVTCVGYNGDGATEFYSGTVDAVLISSTTFPAAPIHRNSLDLRGAPPRL